MQVKSSNRKYLHRQHLPSRKIYFAQTIGKILSYLILGILLLFVVLTVVFPKVMGASTYTVLTGSMRPDLEPGHLIGVKPTPVAELKIGDVITYQLESGKPATVTHRIVGKSQSSGGQITFTTQGDANNVVDKLPVQEVQIQGKLVYAIPYIGRITNLLTPQTKAAVTTVLGIGIIGYGVSLFVPKRPSRGRRAASGAGMVLLAGALAIGPNLAPVQATTARELPGLEVSQDGVRWDGAVAVDIFPDAGLIVPGQTLSAAIWIRNASQQTISASVTGTWADERSGDLDDEGDPLRDYLDLSYGPHGASTWEITELAPQEVQETTVQMTFSNQATGYQNSSASLSLVVTAQELLAQEPEEPGDGLEFPSDEETPGKDSDADGVNGEDNKGSEDLAKTGSDLGLSAVWIAALTLLLGASVRIFVTKASRNRSLASRE